MMQGDKYSLAIELKYLSNGAFVTDAGVEDIEITIGPMRRTLSGGDLQYVPSLKKWLFPVSQEQTMGLWPKRYKAQARIVWPGGEIEGVKLGLVRVDESISKEVL